MINLCLHSCVYLFFWWAKKILTFLNETKKHLVCTICGKIQSQRYKKSPIISLTIGTIKLEKNNNIFFLVLLGFSFLSNIKIAYILNVFCSWSSHLYFKLLSVYANSKGRQGRVLSSVTIMVLSSGKIRTNENTLARPTSRYKTYTIRYEPGVTRKKWKWNQQQVLNY